MSDKVLDYVRKALQDAYLQGRNDHGLDLIRFLRYAVGKDKPIDAGVLADWIEGGGMPAHGVTLSIEQAGYYKRLTRTKWSENERKQ